MPIFNSYRSANFTVIANPVINDERLSFKARGLLIYLLSKPPYWEVTSAQLAGASPQGITAIRSALKELVSYGYARLVKLQAPSGKFAGQMWEIFEDPQKK